MAKTLTFDVGITRFRDTPQQPSIEGNTSGVQNLDSQSAFEESKSVVRQVALDLSNIFTLFSISWMTDFSSR